LIFHRVKSSRHLRRFPRFHREHIASRSRRPKSRRVIEVFGDGHLEPPRPPRLILRPDERRFDRVNHLRFSRSATSRDDPPER